MNENWYMKTACVNCPFRKDVKPFLTAARYEELATAVTNPYNSFPCHKTLGTSECGEDTEVVETSKECAGFMALQHIETGEELPSDFKQDFSLIYGSAWDLEEAIELFDENQF